MDNFSSVIKYLDLNVNQRKLIMIGMISLSIQAAAGCLMRDKDKKPPQLQTIALLLVAGLFYNIIYYKFML